ncbi:MAG: putative selenate reductase subunit YgfK [Bacteroidales bacterium]|nr:putative selenate reductase subunit YgfK [Bacteroidales bacterium]
MTDHFSSISIRQLYQLIIKELKIMDSIFGIPSTLFYQPFSSIDLRTEIFGKPLYNPIGVAAGPHSQMAQNIIGAWLCGARYIELKTVQTLDELDISKPCIDMQDEGYNCEWSQELKINESFDEYLNAWIIIHILHRELGYPGNPETIFNMSVGYNLNGIMQENVQGYLCKMKDCSAELTEKKDQLREFYPAIDKIDIPIQISNSITLSTMHGCPANEIESIATYLLKEKGLHTYVKLNPTLLGPVKLRQILNDKLQFKTIVPDEAFAHDLKYDDALNIIRSLQKVAGECNLHFGLKLSNTLESVNNKPTFSQDIHMMYMSGRALHPLTVNLASILQKEFDGELELSFSGGADAFNVAGLLGCGFKTITVCTDLLKPGGYMRLPQYFEEIEKCFTDCNAHTINDFIALTANVPSNGKAALLNLEKYAVETVSNTYYKREQLVDRSIKTKRKLGEFDCIAAPCVESCATNQAIPDYLFHTAKGDFDKAFEVILQTNPFPSITGMVCDHLCQNKCTRINYDEALLIREVKRFISEQDEVELTKTTDNNIKIAVVGAGPSGLACAFYLALAGSKVEVFEAKSKAGGMVQFAIPGFRLTDEAIEKDFKRVTDLGVNIHYNHKIDKSGFEKLKSDYNFVYIAAGAQLSTQLFPEESALHGLLDPLDFLFGVKAGEKTGIGKNVVIIGGGNTAMDAARTAIRLVGTDGKVTIVYRRTINEMPADQGEIKAVMEEGVQIVELVSPEKIIRNDGIITGLLCSRMILKTAEANQRAIPEKVVDSEFTITCDTIIPAIGQQRDFDFINPNIASGDKINYRTQINNVFVGGDALRGAATAIKAIGDGRKVTEQMLKQAGLAKPVHDFTKKTVSREELLLKRTRRAFPPALDELKPAERINFSLVSRTLPKELIIKESDRCLHCDVLCSICTTVCPNFANMAYQIEPFSYQIEKATFIKGEILIEQAGTFAINQTEQILNIANFCNECGNCSTFCPTSGAPYKHKPKVYLTISSFDAAQEGYYFDEFDRLIFKNKDGKCSLSENENAFLFDSDEVFASLQKNRFTIENIVFKTRNPAVFTTQLAATMRVVFEGVKLLAQGIEN